MRGLGQLTVLAVLAASTVLFLVGGWCDAADARKAPALGRSTSSAPEGALPPLMQARPRPRLDARPARPAKGRPLPPSIKRSQGNPGKESLLQVVRKAVEGMRQTGSAKMHSLWSSKRRRQRSRFSNERRRQRRTHDLCGGASEYSTDEGTPGLEGSAGAGNGAELKYYDVQTTGYCSSDLDAPLNSSVSSAQECWDSCQASHPGENILAVDWYSDESFEPSNCWCQNDCWCMLNVDGVDPGELIMKGGRELPAPCNSDYSEYDECYMYYDYDYDYVWPPLLSTKPANSSITLEISSASVSIKTWELPDAVSGLSGPDMGASRDMTFAVITITFSTDIALDIGLPVAEDLRWRAREYMSDPVLKSLAGLNNSARTLEGATAFDVVSTWDLPYTPWADDMLLTLANDFEAGHDVTFQDCHVSPDEIVMIPPTSNAMPSFLQKWMKKETGVETSKLDLFANATRASNKLVFVAPLDGVQDRDFSQCRVTVGSGALEQAVQTANGDCSAKDLTKFAQIVEPFLDKLDSVAHANQFEAGLVTLSLIKMIDGFETCKSLLESMLVTSEEASWVAGVRGCTHEQGSDPWRFDPCCNPEVAFTECCPIRDVEEKTIVIKSVSPAPQCNASLSEELLNALLSFSMAHKLRTDKHTGCTAVRNRKLPPKKMENLFQFLDTCYDLIFTGKTKSGKETCQKDNECYTEKCEQSSGSPDYGAGSGYGSGGGSSANPAKRCRIPYGDYEGPFTTCGIDNMDPMLLNWLRKEIGASADVSMETLRAEIFDRYAEETCAGSSAENGGACMLDATSDQCNSNVFNYLGSHEPFASVYIDKSKEDESACGSTADRKWFGHEVHFLREDQDEGAQHYAAGRKDANTFREVLGCVCTDPWSAAWTCTRTTVALNQYTGMQNFSWDWDWFPDPSSQGGSLLQTNYIDEPPDGGMLKCRLTNFDDATRYSFSRRTWTPMSPPITSQELCDAMSQTLKSINAWQTSTTVAASFQTFKTTYEWLFDEAVGEWVKVKMSSASKEWCEWEKACNHRPWVESEEECVTAYKTGELALKGDSFCAQCDGPYCWDISSPTQCVYPSIYEDSRCTGVGGVWQSDTWQCAVDNRSDHTAQTCMGEFCPAETYFYTDWQGDNVSRTSYGFCEYESVCHDPAVTNADECNRRRVDNATEFPRWYSTWSELDDSTRQACETSVGWRRDRDGIVAKECQRFYPAKGMCVYWAEQDLSGYMDSAWYEKAYGSKIADYSTKDTCESAGHEWLMPKYFQEGQWNTQEKCEAGVCSSAPWSWELAKDPSKCTTRSGMCSRYCKSCQSRTVHQEFCVLPLVKTKKDCLDSEKHEGTMIWNDVEEICYTTMDKNSKCFRRDDARIHSCQDLGSSGCTRTGWQDDKMYNGILASRTGPGSRRSHDGPELSDALGLDCYTDYYATCKDKNTCESGGICSDEAYEPWQDYYLDYLEDASQMEEAGATDADTLNSCDYAYDDVCDEPNFCDTGTDTSDCANFGPNSCEYARDGICDEPDYCTEGTDTEDCSSQQGSDYDDSECPWKDDGFCDEPGLCPDGTDGSDCLDEGDAGNTCPYTNDGMCDEPALCAPGTDTMDCSRSQGEDSCPDAFNGRCDEPTNCKFGTDTTDCSSIGVDSCMHAKDGVCDEPYLCPPGSDTTDCNSALSVEDSCEWSNDGYCDEPDWCPAGTDTTDCRYDPEFCSDTASCGPGKFCNFADTIDEGVSMACSEPVRANISGGICSGTSMSLSMCKSSALDPDEMQEAVAKSISSVGTIFTSGNCESLQQEFGCSAFGGIRDPDFCQPGGKYCQLMTALIPFYLQNCTGDDMCNYEGGEGGYYDSSGGNSDSGEGGYYDSSGGNSDSGGRRLGQRRDHDDENEEWPVCCSSVPHVVDLVCDMSSSSPDLTEQVQTMRDKGECRDWDCVGFGTSGDSGNGARRFSTAVVPKAASGAHMLTSVSKHLRRTLGALKTRALVEGMRRPSGRTRHKGFKAQERKKQRAAGRGRPDQMRTPVTAANIMKRRRGLGRGRRDHDSSAAYDGNSVCRIPFNEGNEWGGPNSDRCYELGGWSDWQDACVVYDIRGEDCVSEGGRVEQRAETREACTAAHRQGCFDTDMNLNTAIDRQSCQDSSICDPDKFVWKNVFEWRPGQWTESRMQSDGIAWKARALEPKNKMVRIVAWDTLMDLVHRAGYSLMAEAYKTEFKCQIEPVYKVLELVACACASDSAQYSAACDDTFVSIPSSTVAVQTLWTNIEVQTLSTAVGSFSITGDTIRSSINASSVDNLQAQVLATSAFSLRAADGQRRETEAFIKTTCSQFEVVPNTNGGIVGQLIGNGVTLKGLSRGFVKACLRVDQDIPLCLSKYSVQDFAIGTSDNRPGQPLGLSVTMDKSNAMCSMVQLNSSGTTMVFPILRTKNMQPYQVYVGKKVTSTLKLDIQSKELFTLDKMNAFKKSIAAAVKIDAISADKIVIIRVCDDAGCIDLASTRRVTSGGIRVEYQVQADDVAIESIQSALESDSFGSAFERSMAANGYKVKADITTSSAPATPTPANVGGTDDTPSPPADSASKRNMGGVIGGAVGGAVALILAAITTRYFHRKSKATGPASSLASGQLVHSPSSAQITTRPTVPQVDAWSARQPSDVEAQAVTAL